MRRLTALLTVVSADFFGFGRSPVKSQGLNVTVAAVPLQHGVAGLNASRQAIVVDNQFRRSDIDLQPQMGNAVADEPLYQGMIHSKSNSSLVPSSHRNITRSPAVPDHTIPIPSDAAGGLGGYLNRIAAQLSADMSSVTHHADKTTEGISNTKSDAGENVLPQMGLMDSLINPHMIASQVKPSMVTDLQTGPVAAVLHSALAVHVSDGIMPAEMADAAAAVAGANDSQMIPIPQASTDPVSHVTLAPRRPQPTQTGLVTHALLNYEGEPKPTTPPPVEGAHVDGAHHAGSTAGTAAAAGGVLLLGGGACGLYMRRRRNDHVELSRYGSPRRVGQNELPRRFLPV